MTTALELKPYTNDPGLRVAQALFTRGPALNVVELERLVKLDRGSIEGSLLQLIAVGLVMVEPRGLNTPEDRVQFSWMGKTFEEDAIREALGDAPPVRVVPVEEREPFDIPKPSYRTLVSAFHELRTLYQKHPQDFTEELVTTCRWLGRLVGEEKLS